MQLLPPRAPPLPPQVLSEFTSLSILLLEEAFTFARLENSFNLLGLSSDGPLLPPARMQHRSLSLSYQGFLPNVGM